jgi:uncharacterized protein YeaO (DUF488 family)
MTEPTQPGGAAERIRLATCSFAAYRPEFGKPVRISLGRPKRGVDPDDSLRDLTPHYSYLRASPDEFARKYRAQLKKVGVARLRAKLCALDDGRPLILLCFERDGADCHRILFSRWWLEQTGEIIPEIGGTSKHEEQPWRT